jgi:hypothetical protein
MRPIIRQAPDIEHHHQFQLAAPIFCLKTPIFSMAVSLSKRAILKFNQNPAS